jgi:hypothetical protein
LGPWWPPLPGGGRFGSGPRRRRLDRSGKTVDALSQLNQAPVEALHVLLAGDLETPEGSRQRLLERLLERDVGSHDALLRPLDLVLYRRDRLADGTNHSFTGVADELLQELLRHGTATFALVAQDDLGEGYGGEVFTAAPVDDLDVLTTSDQLTDAL